MKILLVGPTGGDHNANYIHNALIEMGHIVAIYNPREVMKDIGVEKLQLHFIEQMENLQPDLTIVLKGLEFKKETIESVRKVCNSPIVNWIFDVTLAGTMVEEAEWYVHALKAYTTFYTIDEDAVEPLIKLGVNAKLLSEASQTAVYGEQILNYVQKKKFGADVVFIGSVGGIHDNREELLARIHAEGIPLKIFGEVLYKENTEPNWVRECHSGFGVMNDMHSVACNSAKIVLGCDGWPKRSKSNSSRMYRTMDSGAFYLNTNTKGTNEIFQPGVHYDVYNDADDMIERIIYYLMNEQKRKDIAKEGQKEVQEKHQFKHRLAQIIEDIE
jgi:spore maturation protein CgeB